MDIDTMTLAELEDLHVRVGTRIEQMRLVEAAPEQVRVLVTCLLEATGREMGAPWQAPGGAHDAYPAGWVVAHDGKTWESLVAGNAHEPGVSGWREVVPEGAAPAEFVQPTGAHDAYGKGARVTFEGQVWRSLIDGNVWSPSDHPAGWELVP